MRHGRRRFGRQRAFCGDKWPFFCEEVMRGMPTALTLAASRQADADKLQEQLHRPFLRLYKNDDIVGVCVAGALKNIIAIAAGVCDGMALDITLGRPWLRGLWWRWPPSIAQWAEKMKRWANFAASFF